MTLLEEILARKLECKVQERLQKLQERAMQSSPMSEVTKMRNEVKERLEAEKARGILLSLKQRLGIKD